MSSKLTCVSIFFLSIFLCCNSKPQKNLDDYQEKASINSWHLPDSLFNPRGSTYLVIGHYSFPECSWSDLYFDTSNILSVKIIKPVEAMTLFGRAAKYGVLSIDTKGFVEWTSSNEIFEDHVNQISSTFKKTLFNINHNLFKSNPNMHFDKDIIKEVKVANDSIFWEGEWFYSTLSVKLSR